MFRARPHEMQRLRPVAVEPESLARAAVTVGHDGRDAGGTQRQLGILFATGLLLTTAAAGWVFLTDSGGSLLPSKPGSKQQLRQFSI
jgi:hypothetical protein